MPGGAAPQAVLLAALLAGLRGATGRLLSGECARWGGGWFPGALGCGTHGTPGAADRLQGHGASSLALGGEGGGVAPPPHQWTQPHRLLLLLEEQSPGG